VRKPEKIRIGVKVIVFEIYYQAQVSQSVMDQRDRVGVGVGVN
jgi:hypothetical protein